MIDDDAWDELLDLIADGHVLPLVGWGVTTFGDDDSLLMPWLAGRLAERLRVAEASLPAGFSINDVVTRYVTGGEPRDKAYKELHRVLRAESLEPGPSLRQLASVTGLRLLVSMTPDSLLSQALNAVRHGGREVTQVCEFSPKSETRDTPGRLRDLSRRSESTVFHILGRAANVVDGFVIWDEDLLEFILELNNHLGPALMPNLSKDLEDRNVQILAIGVSFSDWLMRFFLRVIRKARLTEREQADTWLVDAPDNRPADNVVMFFGTVATRIKVFDMPPREFVRELARRWQERHPPAEDSTASPAIAPFPTEMTPGAIFVSYVREDEPAVRNLVSRLQSAGCDVWLDLERLQSGMSFDHRIEDYIKRRCSLFISVVSHQTEAQSECYAHLERNWAAERARRISDADRDLFYHPVVTDQIDPGSVRREPYAFSGVHRPVYISGQVDDDFCQRLRGLQQNWLGRNGDAAP